jgi:hypothetical protein
MIRDTEADRPARFLAAIAVLVAGLLLAACTADRPHATRPTGSVATAPTAAPAAQPSATCPASADLGAAGAGLPERQGIGHGVTLWGLFFAPKAVAGNEIKIAWRMTGAGDLTMTASGPDGATTKPTWGPEGHGGSSFHRPGDEWGTGWVFPSAGCWRIDAKRDSGTAQMILRVAAV